MTVQDITYDNRGIQPATDLAGNEFQAWTARFVANGETLLWSQIDIACGDAEHAKMEHFRGLEKFLADR